jgi:N-sulfoglucosamine sulfohydrolase
VAAPPNVVYLHSHDTGRMVAPYGFAVPTPRISSLAASGRVYRRAFACAPVCSPSRAALLTGQYPHETGMLGLAHRGFALHDRSRHLANALRPAGYTSVLAGMQHEAERSEEIGYDRVLEVVGGASATSTRARDVAPVAAAALREGLPEPFFLSVGFFETHREFAPAGEHAPAPPANLPDVPATRRDMAGLAASAALLDEGVGTVVDAVPANTLVILTTDHGVPFPGAKATLTDRGLGVMLVLAGLGLHGASDALVSHVDVYPTIFELAGLPVPACARGRSLLREGGHEQLFGELTFHAAYEPQRSVRTRRHKYIRRFDGGLPVLANIDDSPSKTLLVESGLAERVQPAEQLYDVLFDPNEAANLAGDPAYASTLDGLRSRLEAWMSDTADPLLDGPVAPPPGATLNLPDQRSPSDPTVTV